MWGFFSLSFFSSLLMPWIFCFHSFVTVNSIESDFSLSSFNREKSWRLLSLWGFSVSWAREEVLCLLPVRASVGLWSPWNHMQNVVCGNVWVFFCGKSSPSFHHWLRMLWLWKGNKHCSKKEKAPLNCNPVTWAPKRSHWL